MVTVNVILIALVLTTITSRVGSTYYDLPSDADIAEATLQVFR